MMGMGRRWWLWTLGLAAAANAWMAVFAANPLWLRLLEGGVAVLCLYCMNDAWSRYPRNEHRRKP